MAYDTKKLYDKAIKDIREHKLVFVYEVVSCLGITDPTFYVHFPEDSKESKNIKKALETNRIAVKQKLRKKWEDSGNATLQAMLYKLLATKKELAKLSDGRDLDDDKQDYDGVEFVNEPT